ncbi:MAG TPA: LysR family transcriptional regulator [Bryobacteraceae bacterium]|nr:LysR family transcriptional regulator [Bryobacteraceae bacterium]
MDLHQLRVFQAAVKTGGFTRASEHLCLSQSTVSQHIKQLEQELGCPLFLRAGKRVMVSEAGSLLLQHADKILRDLNNAEMSVRELGATQRGTVRLGAGATTLTYRLPQVLASYNRRFPEIELVVLSGTTEFLLNAVRTQSVDLAVVMSQEKQPGVTLTPLGPEELTVVVNGEHPLARKRLLQPQDLTGLRFILYEKRTAMQALIDNFFKELQIEPRVIMEMENIEVIKSLVRSGLGASILPVCAVDGPPRDSQLRTLRVKGARLTRQLSLAAIESGILPGSICELRSALLSHLGAEK